MEGELNEVRGGGRGEQVGAFLFIKFWKPFLKGSIAEFRA